MEKQAPTSKHLEIIKEEETFVEKVKAVLKIALSQKTYHEDYRKQLDELQEALKTVKNEDVASIYNEYHLLESKAKRDRDIRNILPPLESPYFAHMRLKEENGSRDIFLGHQSYISSKDKVVIINWKDAPISRIFFTYKEGESFEEDLPGGRVITGELEARRILTIVNGNLVGIKLPDVSFQKTQTGEWISSEQVLPHLSGGEGTATRGYLGTGMTGVHRPEVSALLDTEQFELLHMEEETPLMILGGAGSGKTTVALHRLAALVHKDTRKYAHDRIVAIVPEKGLVRLSQKILANLGIEHVEIATYDYWVAKQARRVAGNFPRRICDFTPLNVVKFKSHEALLTIIPDYIEHARQEIAKRINGVFPEHTKFSEYFLDLKDELLITALNDTEKFIMKNFPGKKLESKLERVRSFFVEEKRDLFDLMKDRTDLFSNRPLLRKAVKRSNDELIDSMVKDVVTHMNNQLKESAKKRYADIDESKLQTLDGKSVDYQTPDDVANTIDVEDFSILLEILNAKVGALRTPKGNIKKYNHMVLDEAQELNSTELSVLKRALNDNPSITIAGDAAQQIDPTSSFTTWEAILTNLNQKHSHSVHLNTSYRSPKPIAEFAHKILGEIAPAQMPKIIKDGAPVSITPLSNRGHMSILLSDTLSDLQDREPGATIAIIAKTPESAEHYYNMVQDLPKVRLVLDGEFDFTNGIDVTCVKQVKGLEFDYVVIPDADAVTYPNNHEARRQMHVAATRAIHQLWVISIGTPSIIIPKD